MGEEETDAVEETDEPAAKAGVDLIAPLAAAKEELAAYKNADDYRADEQTALAEAIAAGNAAIDEAADADAVDAALATAKAALDAIKTDAELTAEELAADTAAAQAVEALIAEIGKVTYTEACRQKIETAQNAVDSLTPRSSLLWTRRRSRPSSAPKRPMRS